MEARTIVAPIEALSLAYYCRECEGKMLPTKTIGGEASLTCCRCGHEVMAATRLYSCKVGSQAAR